MKNNKTPGIDGLTAEFFKQVPIALKIILNCWNHSILVNSLPKIWNTAIINIIYKKGPPDDLNNYRPISLLPVAYKIITKAVNERIKKLLNNCIPEEQRGFVPGRKIQYNILHIKSIIQNEIEGAILFADLEKAFDTVSREYIYKVLNDIGLPSIANTVKLLLNETKAAVQINGFLSQLFTIRRGVRQGDPLSPTIFIISLLPFLYSIIKESNLKGLSNTKMLCFADDIANFFNSKEELNLILKKYHDLEQASGLKLNANKSKILNLGETRIKSKEINSSIEEKYLGVLINKNNSTNMDIIIERLKKKINMWSKIKLSLIGRNIIARSAIYPSISYQLIANEVNEKEHKNIQSLMFKYIFQNATTTRISFNKMYQKEEGLNSVNIKSHIEAFHAKYLIEATTFEYGNNWAISLRNAIDSAVHVKDVLFKRVPIKKNSIENNYFTNLYNSYSKIDITSKYMMQKIYTTSRRLRRTS